MNNEDCNACHNNELDRHPTHRFLEPRFKKQREVISPHRCVSCHQVHSGQRIVAQLDFCQHCHAELAILNDTTNPTHGELVKGKKWESCLGCHDFHGNHKAQPPTELTDAIDRDALLRYFKGGDSPYPGELNVKAKATR